MFKNLLSIAISSIATLSAFGTLANPHFGLDWGAPKDDIVGEIIRDDSIVVLQDLYVPKTMPIFERYTAYATNEHGLYATTASSEYITNDLSGKKGKAKFFDTIRYLEKMGFKKRDALIKNSGNGNFYACLNDPYKKPCSFYMWSGYDQNRDSVTVSLNSSMGERGYVEAQFVRKGFSIHGKY